MRFPPFFLELLLCSVLFYQPSAPFFPDPFLSVVALSAFCSVWLRFEGGLADSFWSATDFFWSSVRSPIQTCSLFFFFFASSPIEMTTVSPSLLARPSSYSSHVSNLDTSSQPSSWTISLSRSLNIGSMETTSGKSFRLFSWWSEEKGRLVSRMVLFLHHTKVQPTTVPGRLTTPLSWLC